MKLIFMDFLIPYLLKDIDHPLGGACVRQYALAKGLIELGHKVGILTWKGAKEFVGRDLEFDLVEAYPLDRGIPKLRWFYSRFPSMLKATWKYNPDYLLAITSGTNVGVIALISKLLTIRFAYLVANDIEVDKRFNKREGFINRKIYKWGLERAKYILAQNNYQYNILKRLYSANKVIKIYNPYYCLNNLPQIKSGRLRKYIAWIGIFQYQKNLPALLRVARNNSRIEFRIAGMSGNVDKSTKIALQDLKKCENVRFVGYLNRTEILPFLSKAYALLNTSHYEGFSNTFLESFAAGTPVITLGVNLDEIITKYSLGFVTKESEISQIFNKLDRHYDYIKYGWEMRKYLDEKHNYKKIAASLIKILEITL